MDGGLTLPLTCEICGEDQPLQVTMEEKEERRQRELQMEQALAKTMHQGLVRKILTRGHVMALEHAVDAWHLQAGLHMQRRALALRMFARSIDKTKNVLFGAWQALTMQGRMRAELETSKQLKLCQFAERTLMQRARTALTTAIASWRHKQRGSRVGKTAATRWSRKTTYAAWSTWVVRAGEAQRLRMLGSRVCRRWKHRSVAGAWARWVQQHGEMKRLAKAAGKAASRWRHMCVAQAWARWVEQGRRRRRMRRCAESVMRRWQNMHLARAFRLMSQRALDIKGMRRAGSTVVARWQRLGLWRSLMEWSETAADQQRMARAADCMARR